MRTKKKTIYGVGKLLFVALCALSLCACSSTAKEEKDTSSQQDTSAEQTKAPETDTDESGTDAENEGEKDADSSLDAKPDPDYKIYEPKKEVQNDEHEKNETLAIMHIKDFGDITLKFFPKSAPKAVENFVTHAKQGYYDGLTFHRVIDDFMIQGGDPTGTGAGGESIWGGSFEDEFVDTLAPIRGALCMANAGADTNGSQFFIVQAKETYGEDFDTYFADTPMSDEQKTLLKENGGTPWLVGAHTVFGQVVEGMDVVDAIAKVEVDALNSMPEESVVISGIEIVDPK